MKKTIISLSTILLLQSGVALAEQKNTSTAALDESFAKKVAQDNYAEIQMGELAQNKGASDAVKDYGEALVRDHTKANEELKNSVKNASILPDGPSTEQVKHLEMLKKLDGQQFDTEFAKHMAQDHKKAIAAFEKQAQSGKDQNLKAFAENTLPTLREHLKTAEEITGANSQNRARQRQE